MNKICVIGGGASGLTAAIAAARRGAEVFILEQKEKAGKKILATGNGRCNLTNTYMSPECFRGGNPEFIQKVLENFGFSDTWRFFEELGVVLKKRGTYVYPRTDQASTILEVLMMELLRLKVRIYTDTKVTGIEPVRKGFKIYTASNNQRFQADKVILATGGKAAAKLGSDGSGYTLAKSLGHTITPVVPALVQLRTEGSSLKKAAGVRTECKVTLYIEGVKAAEDTGELQITDYGISGIPVFQVSRYASMALYEKKEVKALLDFLPGMEEKEYAGLLQKRREGRKEDTAEDFLIGIFHKKLIPVLLKEAGISCHAKVKELDGKKLKAVVKACKEYPVKISAANSFEQAQVCAGGVCTQEVDENTMESRYVPGLYITGELLDVDGICGGYNLNFSWSTGYCAGCNSAGINDGCHCFL